MIGAGIAGLTVANALAHAAVDCVVLEARNRIGGRLYTGDLGGSPVDFGGSWIHHPEGNPIRRFAQLDGIECRPGNPLPSLAAFDCVTGLWLSPEDIDESLTGVQDRYNEALAGLRTRLGPAASAAEGIEAYLATTGLTGDALRRARQALGSRRSGRSRRGRRPVADVAVDASGVRGRLLRRPARGWLCLSGGRVGAGLDVRQDWPAVRVELTGGGVTVTSASGETEAGSHVVVTVPLGVLKNDLPAFAPPLPPERAEVVRRLGFGRYEKVALKFDEPFWHEAGWSHLVLFPSEAGEPAL